jgi:F-type H+-transporting ATPase subunit b
MTLASLGGTAATGALDFFASGGVDIDFDATFVVQMLVFTALIFILKPLLFEPVLGLFEERERRTEGARGEAREMQERAGKLLVEYEAELERINRVAAEERDRTRSETARLEGEILAEARAAASKVVDEGRARITEETRKIQFELGRESERIAREIATQVLGREVR